MSGSKSVYQAVALAIYSVRRPRNVEGVIKALANTFADTNPRFDRERFVAACNTGALGRMTVKAPAAKEGR